ncbi:MAG TPA: hypothetical protein VM052_03575, partial [Candidatus Limnocylindrales bacterium]|nr:hypothetical protein [Candidatus Limnocylindrales bacterium]
LRTGAEHGSVDTAHEGVALSPFVVGEPSVKWYVPRIVEKTATRPDRYRMAVTESGINDAGADGARMRPPRGSEPHAAAAVALIWIAAPATSHAGLLILVGSVDDGTRLASGDGWPLPLIRDLGVRIYESGASTMAALEEARVHGRTN